jgi:hypothetical protein
VNATLCHGDAWAERAGDLAIWAMARLVNRTDAWGAYRPDEEIGREFTRPDGSKGTLGEQRTVTGRLTHAILARHFRARTRGEIIGLHTAGKDNTSKGGALDIDHHGPTSTAADVNLQAALHWYAALGRLGFRPLLLDSNGKGGFHLRLLLAEAVPAERVFHLLRSLTRDHEMLGFEKPPEQFPKQADVRRCHKGLGNWLRMPGRHHKRDFWSRVWDGNGWLDGNGAINFMLALEGDPSALLPPPAAARAGPPVAGALPVRGRRQPRHPHHGVHAATAQRRRGRRAGRHRLPVRRLPSPRPGPVGRRDPHLAREVGRGQPTAEGARLLGRDHPQRAGVRPTAAWLRPARRSATPPRARRPPRSVHGRGLTWGSGWMLLCP